MNRKVIGVCFSGVGEEYQSDIINSLIENSKKFPTIRLLFFVCYSDRFGNTDFDMGEENIYNLINYDKLDALFILSETIKNSAVRKKLVAQAKAHNVPVVSFDLEMDGCYNIVINHSFAISDMMHHIYEEHGCRKINFMAGVFGNEISDSRYNSYVETLKELGLEFDEQRVAQGGWWTNPAVEATEKWFADGLDFDAVVCANDVMAMAVIRVVKEHGLRVPEDVIVTGLDNIVEGRYHTPQLTTVRMRNEEGIIKALEMLENIFAGKEIEQQSVYSPEMIYSESCGCQKTAERVGVNEFLHHNATEINRLHKFNMHMSRVGARLDGCSSVEVATEELKKIVAKAWTYKVWICVDEKFFDDSYTGRLAVSYADGEFEYPAKMRVVAFKDGYNIKSDLVFETSELIPKFYEELDECKILQFCPLHANKKVVGYLVKDHTNNQFGQQWCSFSMGIANSLETIKQQSQLKGMIAQLEDMYIRDSMTQLYNRRGFFQKLREVFVVKEPRNMMIISIDLDGLKDINDMHGHLEGDFAINVIARALNDVSQMGEICARFGGDEFIIAGVDIDDEYQLAYEKRFDDFIKNVNETSDKPYKVKASFGMVIKKNEKFDSIDELIRLADERMYLQKAKSGRNYRNR